MEGFFNDHQGCLEDDQELNGEMQILELPILKIPIQEFEIQNPNLFYAKFVGPSRPAADDE